MQFGIKLRPRGGKGGKRFYMCHYGYEEVDILLNPDPIRLESITVVLSI